MSATPSADYDCPPAGIKTVCTNCGDPIVYDPINLWIHDGVGGDPVPCDGEVPVAEPLASWDWRDDESHDCDCGWSDNPHSPLHGRSPYPLCPHNVSTAPGFWCSSCDATTAIASDGSES